jgi:ribulose-phosphate 3-epimerase
VTVPQNIIVAPSILAGDFGNFARDAQRTEQGGGDWLHCDVMDGHFVENITFGPDTIAAFRKATKLQLDVHLMIDRPDQYIDRFVDAGADHLIVHLEAPHDVAKTLAQIRGRGKSAGLAINPGTPAKKALPFLDQIDELLVMTVQPGFGGQPFLPDMLGKVRELRSAAQDLPIIVDGGINPETGRQCVAAGANVLVAGNSLFRHKTLNLAEAIAELRKHATNQD